MVNGVMKRHKKLFYCLPVFIIMVIFSGYSPMNCMAAVNARLDRQAISIDETVNLVITADGALNSFSSLDTSALEKDFTIVNQSTSSSFQIINGSSKATKTWNIELEARHAGTLTIPSFTIHGEKTKPLTLKVYEANQAIPGSSAVTGDVYLEVLPAMETPAYLQGQITVSVKLFIKSQLNLAEASLEEPKVEHATVIKLGDDRRYQSRKNGVLYQVIERKYAIFPEEGREVVVPPLLFQGGVNAGSSRFFSNDPFFDRFGSRRRRIRARSQELKIPLTPIPDGFTGKVWLPAGTIKIKEEKKPAGKMKVGEPLTRTIQIEAWGLTAEQLPELKIKAPEGCKVYLDQPELKNEVGSNDWMHGIKRQSMAFIPSRPGTFVLPEIVIDWWDVINNRQQKAALPARRITVVAVSGQHNDVAEQQNSHPAATKTASPPALEKRPEMAKKSATETMPPATSNVRLWQSVSLVLLLAWFFTLYLWLKTRSRQESDKQEGENQAEMNVTAQWEQVKKACLANNPHLVQQAILAWAAAAWPQNPPTNLKKLAAVLGNAELAAAFAALEETLYRPNSSREWNGNQFWQLIAKNLRKPGSGKNKTKKDKKLPPLYSPPA